MHFDEVTINRGYTAEYNTPDSGGWGTFRLAIVPNLVNEPVYLDLKTFDCDELPDPGNGLRRVSDCFIYDILREDQATKEPLILNRPFILSMKISEPSNYYRKRIYYWNAITEAWVPLPSSADYDNNYIRSFTHLPFSRVAVFEDSSTTPGYGVEGVASWYRDTRYPYGAASNDYPLGTRLRVRNVDNGKTVDVEITSTGPFFPFSYRRVLDLTLNAFSDIAESWKGVARVQTWPLDSSGSVLGAETYAPVKLHPPTQPDVIEPQPSAAAAIAINEHTEEILYSKNYDTVLPIASITKLMTAHVFFQTGTPFNTIVTYHAEDNAIGSKLYITPGERVTAEQLLYTMLTGSANNAANALVRSTGLSTEAFVARMNQQADAWGLTHTTFTDVSGLDPGNVSTVYDIARMAKYVMDDIRVLRGTTQPVYNFQKPDGGGHTIKTSAKGITNGILDGSLIITGTKTGYLDEAGYCFVMKARQDRDTLNHVITVILNAGTSDPNLRYRETNELMRYGLNKL